MGAFEGYFGSLRLSRGYWFTSCIPSSWIRFQQSLVQVLDRSSFHSPSRMEGDAVEDQEEHSRAVLVELVVSIHDLCDLHSALAEAKKMNGFCMAQDSDDYPA